MNTVVRDPPIHEEPIGSMGRDVTAPLPHHPWRHFARHSLEMTAVMGIGMFAAAFLFMIILNLAVGREIRWEQALLGYPVHALLAVAIGMSVPMIPWMRHRGHSRRSAYEMAVVMALLAIPFVCLALLGVVKGAQCGLYCLAGLVAMVALMVYRRADYGVDESLPRLFALFNRNVANPVIRLFAGQLPPFAIVSHRGRVTARAYSTPVLAFRTKDGLVFGVLYGAASDWVKNVLAAGNAQVKRVGVTREYGQARLVDSTESMRLVPTIFRVAFRLFRVCQFVRVTATGS
jgi:deazaflavin-dependent oxidoreductase (nitroreductase family)